jgi:hypothetical protein
MTMLDTAMALAAQTTLSPGETCPSHEAAAKFVRPISAETDAGRTNWPTRAPEGPVIEASALTVPATQKGEE